MKHTRPKQSTRRVVTGCLFCLGTLLLADPLAVRETANPGDFPLAAQGKAAVILCDTNDFQVVQIACGLLAQDIENVTGINPSVATDPSHAVIVGTLERSRLVREALKEVAREVDGLRGQWESCLIRVVERPLPQSHPEIESAVLVIGSDRRGAAYGVFGLSEAIGVSPWYWWADVPPVKHTNLFLAPGQRREGPPSVKYRGIFINDEDWGLQPWAARTFEPETGDIGPKTYARIFELMLRLRANYCWPAMHDCTRAFNHYPANRQVADDHAIVMGSTHCEPLLRNNVTEWDAEENGDWDYVTNARRIQQYWDARLITNGDYENVYTVGMRGIHDSGMPGGGTLTDKARRLEQIIDDQRRILTRRTGRSAAEVPQIFCPYKEVLNIYRTGMALPDDITIAWADDNHGYLRQLSTPAEQKRSGRSGVYYHFSYWGEPEDFQWLSSISPSLISYEMTKAFCYGADRLWVFNVGDLKPAEKELTFAMELAWDINRWPPEKAVNFTRAWAARTFGQELAEPVSRILDDYYHLAQRGKPEHIDRVEFSPAERDARLVAYGRIAEQAAALTLEIREQLKDAYFQLVYYPVTGAALMNRKHLLAAQSLEMARQGDPDALEVAASARRAYERIQRITLQYNEEIADGKWRHMMDWKPRGLKVFDMPPVATESLMADASGESGLEIDLATGQHTAPMAFHDGILSGTSEELFRDAPGGSSTFTFSSTSAGPRALWALVHTPSPEEDSWHLEVNGRKAIANDQVTGRSWKWIQLGDFSLNRGQNTLLIGQREPNARIKALRFGSPGLRIAEDALLTLAGSDFSATLETTQACITKLAGFGAGAVTLEPVTAPSVSTEQAAGAVYEANLPAGTRTAVFRFLPTSTIHKGRGLRAAVRINEGADHLVDLHAEEYTAEWSANVLRGYSECAIDFEQTVGVPARVEIRFLDPGLVLLSIDFH